MNGVICYYSGTGNTALVCRRAAWLLPVPFDLVDVTTKRSLDLASADVVGFASPTDFWGVPHAFETFIEGLPESVGTPAFVLNTYGALSGKTLRILAEQVTSRGFQVLGGHSMRMPESYPPMIAGGMGAKNAPGRREIASFDAFIAQLGDRITTATEGSRTGDANVRLGLVNAVVPVRTRTTARDDMGEKFVDGLACTECGICEKLCPYGAIRLDPKPIFDMSRCYGCWRCYNRCPEGAIYTKKFRAGPFYRRPSEPLRRKLET